MKNVINYFLLNNSNNTSKKTTHFKLLKYNITSHSIIQIIIKLLIKVIKLYFKQTTKFFTQQFSNIIKKILLLSKCDLHVVTLWHLEIVQGLFGIRSPALTFKLHKSNFSLPAHYPHLHEALKLLKEHLHLGLLGVSWQVLNKQNVVWQVFFHCLPLAALVLAYIQLHLSLDCLLLGLVLFVGALHFWDDVGVPIGVLDPHWLVVEWKPWSLLWILVLSA